MCYKNENFISKSFLSFKIYINHSLDPSYSGSPEQRVDTFFLNTMFNQIIQSQSRRHFCSQNKEKINNIPLTSVRERVGGEGLI